MKNLKKILSTFTALSMIVSAFAVSNVSAAATIKSDTTQPFSVQMGNAYTFKITANGTAKRPTVTVANGSALKVTFKSVSGWNYFYTVTAVGQAGSTSGVYMALPGQNPIRCCIVTVAAKTTKLSDLNCVTELSDTSRITFDTRDSTTNTGISADKVPLTYFGGYACDSGTYQGYRDYFVNGNYKKFTGIFALSHERRDNADAKWTLNVYGDGKLLYSSDPVYADVLPQTVNVNLSGVKMLRFETQVDVPRDCDDSETGLYNAYLVP